MLFGNPQRIAIALSKELTGRLIDTIYRPQTMDDTPIRQVMSAGQDRLPGMNRRERPTLVSETGTSRRMDRPSNPAAREQLSVRGVDHSIDIRLTSDITPGQLQHHRTKGVLSHPNLHCHSPTIS